MSVSMREKREQMRIDGILDAAQEVFLEKGYYGASVNDIAERAVVSKSTIYQYFDSKESILNAMLARGYRVLTRHVRDCTDGIGDVRLRLFTLIHAELEFFERRRDFFQMLLVEKLDVETGASNDIVPAYHEHLLFLEQEITWFSVNGLFRNVAPEDAAYMIFATMRAFATRCRKSLRGSAPSGRPATGSV